MDCVICGAPHAHKHHIFFGPYRKTADKYGYVVPLCYEHHIGNNGIHFNREMDLAFKRRAQKDFEEKHGSREEFRQLFGRSYLDE